MTDDSALYIESYPGDPETRRGAVHEVWTAAPHKVKGAKLIAAFENYGDAESYVALRAENERLRGFLNEVRPRPHTLNGVEVWNPGTRQIWKDIHEALGDD